MADYQRQTIETKLALLQREVAELREALYGDGHGQPGLVQELERLTEAANRERVARRTVMWLGGAIVALATGIAQLSNAFHSLWTGK